MPQASALTPQESAKDTAISMSYSEPSQSRLYRTDPGARLLLLCSAMGRFSATDTEDRFRPAQPYTMALPFWSSNESHSEFRSLSQLWHFWPWWVTVADKRSDLPSFGIPAARAMIWLFQAAGATPKPEAQAALRAWALVDGPGPQRPADGGAAGWTPEETRRSQVPLARAAGIELINDFLCMLPQALNALHSEEISAERTHELLGLGRDFLCTHFGLTPERAAQTEADKPLALALTRLAFFGASDPRSALCMIMNDSGSESESSFLSAIYDSATVIKKTRNYDYSKNRRLLLSMGSAPEPVDNESSFGIFLRLASQQSRFGSGLPAGHLRLALLALSAEGDPSRAAREGLMRGTSTFDTGQDGATSWSKISPLGDLPLIDLAIVEGRRVSGAPLRGDAMRDSFNSFLNIFRWRNPSNLLNSSYGSSIGPKVLAAALDEAQAFATGAPQALAFALEELGRDPKARRELIAALADRFSQGFNGLSSHPDPSELLPGFERANLGADASEPIWKAGKTSLDPMTKVAALAAKIFDFDAPDAQSLVGEAKKTLFEKAGLSNAAWKAITADASLRTLFSQAARESLRPVPTGNRGTVMRQAEDIMKTADALGDSALARIKLMLARDTRTASVEACAAALSGGATMNLSVADQAEMLLLLASGQASRLRGFFAGHLPCLPRGFSGEDGSLTSAASHLPLMIEDAQAIKLLAPSLLKGLNLRHRKNLAASLLGLAPDNEKGTERARNTAQSATVREFEDVLDCARAMPPGFWSRLDLKDPLSHARRMHEEWNQQLHERGAQASGSLLRSWTSLVHRDRMGNMEAQELVSGRDLFEEGRVMHHCVSSYSAVCTQGGSRVVSMRIDGVRVSTLELAPLDAKGQRLPVVAFDEVASRRKVVRWGVVQHRGKCNAHLTDRPELLAFGETIAQRASVAFSSYTEKLAEKKRLAAEVSEPLASVAPLGTLSVRL